MVDFPLPEGPTIANVRPGLMSKDTFFKIGILIIFTVESETFNKYKHVWQTLRNDRVYATKFHNLANG